MWAGDIADEDVDIEQMISLLRRELPARFGQQHDLRYLLCRPLVVGPNRRYHAALHRASHYFYNKLWFLVLTTLLGWGMALGVALDRAWLLWANFSVIILGFQWALLSRLDLHQWRVVLGTIRNSYVVLASVVSIAAVCTLTASAAVDLSALLGVLFVAAAIYPNLEILDAPVMAYILILPGMISTTAMMVVKYKTTGVLAFSGIVDRHFTFGTHTSCIMCTRRTAYAQLLIACALHRYEYIILCRTH